MSAMSEYVHFVPILLFALLLISGVFFIIAGFIWSTKRNVKDTVKPQIKEKHTAARKFATPPKSKKKISKPNATTPHTFEHSHLLSTLKGQTTPGFSSRGNHFVSSAEVTRSPPSFRRSGLIQGRFTTASHLEEDSGCWLSNSPSSSSNPHSDTEDSLTSSSSSGSKVSRWQRQNKKKKKSDHFRPSRTFDDEPPFFVPQLQKGPVSFKSIRPLGKGEDELHQLLLPLCIKVQDRILNGYPYQTYRGVYVYKAMGFSRLEAVLGNHRLVDAEIEDFSCTQAKRIEEEASDFMSANASLAWQEMNMHKQFFIGTPNNLSRNYQKCSRCRQYFDVGSNGKKTTCFYHPKKAVITEEGSLRYTCCNMFKPDNSCSGCLMSSYHVFHHLSSGINGPLAGFVSTRAVWSTTPSVYGLDCEMVFTSLGFEVVRVTLVNVHGETVLDTFIRPQGEIFDYNTEFSGVLPRHLLDAVSFNEAQSKILGLLKTSDILVGHSLEGDLIVLKILHRRVIDTSLLFKVSSSNSGVRGVSTLPRRQGLKTLVKEHLGRDIQTAGSAGHCSIEDASAALFLVLNKVCGKVSRRHPKRSKVAPLPALLRAIRA